MSSLFSGVKCLDCGHEMPPVPLLNACEACGSSWLDATYNYVELQWPAQLNRRLTSLWRVHLQDEVDKSNEGKKWGGGEKRVNLREP